VTAAGRTANLTPTTEPAQVGRLARLLRSPRRRFAALAIVAAVGGGVLVAHSALAMDHMGDGTGMCVAVLDASLLATGVALLHRRARPTPSRHPTVLLRPATVAPAPVLPIPARSRAGPVALQVFRS